MKVAKKRKKTAVGPKEATIAPVPPAITIDFSGPMQERGVKKTKILASEITLDDGSRIFIKPVVAQVRRALKQYNQYGEPLYLLTIFNSLTTKAPKSLMRPAPKQKKKQKDRGKL